MTTVRRSLEASYGTCEDWVRKNRTSLVNSKATKLVPHVTQIEKIATTTIQTLGTHKRVIAEECSVELTDAAEEGNAEAQFILGQRFARGNGVKLNKLRGFHWLLKAANQKHEKAIHEIALIIEGRRITISQKRVFNLLLRTSTQHSNILFAIGECFEKGKGTKKCDISAFRWFVTAANQNHYKALQRVALFIIEGRAINSRSTFEWFKNKAENGHRELQYMIGWCFANGQCTHQSSDHAASWFGRAANQNHIKSYREIFLLIVEKKVNWPDNIAFSWIKSAAKAGIAEAQYKAALCYFNRKGTGDSSGKGVKYLKLAAAQGNALAQNRLGCFYSLFHREEEGFEQFYRSAKQGNPAAQLNVAHCFAKGNGIRKMPEKAFQYFSYSAAQGNHCAQFQLALCFEKGIGTRLDLTQARALYEKSAGLGNQDAKDALTRLDHLPWWKVIAKAASEVTLTLKVRFDHPKLSTSPTNVSSSSTSLLSKVPNTNPLITIEAEPGQIKSDERIQQELLERTKYQVNVVEVEIDYIKKDEQLSEAYKSYKTELNCFFEACMVAKTKIFGTPQAIKLSERLDKGLEVVSAVLNEASIKDYLTSLIPYFGDAIKFINALIKLSNNAQKMNFVRNAGEFFSSIKDREEIVEILARQLVLAQVNQLKHLSFVDDIECVFKLEIFKKIYEVIKDASNLYNKNFNGIKSKIHAFVLCQCNMIIKEVMLGNILQSKELRSTVSSMMQSVLGSDFQYIPPVIKEPKGALDMISSPQLTHVPMTDALSPKIDLSFRTDSPFRNFEPTFTAAGCEQFVVYKKQSTKAEKQGTEMLATGAFNAFYRFTQ